MIVGGGLFVSRETALKLIEILELSSQLCGSLGGPEYLGPTDRPEVKLHRALLSAAVTGLSPDGIRSCLKEG